MRAVCPLQVLNPEALLGEAARRHRGALPAAAGVEALQWSQVKNQERDSPVPVVNGTPMAPEGATKTFTTAFCYSAFSFYPFRF